MSHPTKIFGHSVEDTAKEIGNLRYDALENLFNELIKDFREQAVEDLNKNRPNLCRDTYSLLDSLKAVYVDAKWLNDTYGKYND